MALDPFDGTTFVAFTDISGFREMMDDEQRAIRALDRFYQAGYDTLRDQNDDPRVDELLVSDSGILFVRGHADPRVQLGALLRIVEAINRKVLLGDVMLTTSISYGSFSYHNRLEFPGIEKNPVYGNAYVSAFLDNEKGTPRIQPGQCRILREPHSNELEAALQGIDGNRVRERGRKHSYFYWMVALGNDIAHFETQYHDAHSLKYRGMLQAIRTAANCGDTQAGLP